MLWIPIVLLAMSAAGCGGGDRELRQLLSRRSGAVSLPPGVIEISSELKLPDGAEDLEIRGADRGTVLRAAKNFRGKAIFRVRAGRNIRFENFAIEGNRAVLEKPVGIAPSDVTFARFYDNNGIVAEQVDSLTIADVRFREIANFAVIVSGGAKVKIERVEITDSGSRNEIGRNNTSGGILIEEGVAGFEVLDCTLQSVRGNGIWTHSLYTSARSRDGRIANNRLDDVGRDAIQVGHATNVRVENNSGAGIGFPNSEVDVENGGTPVAIDTAGNVDRSVYAGNRFEEINGKCIDLDGFHHGEVRDNVCTNRNKADAYPFGHFGIVMNNTNPDMESEAIVIEGNEIDGAKFGGVFVVGTGHRIEGNRFRNLNLAGCNESAGKFGCSHFPNEPDLLQTGVYLGQRAERPSIARKNVIRDNEISGHRMRARCIGAAPQVSLSENRIEGNRCQDTTPN